MEEKIPKLKIPYSPSSSLSSYSSYSRSQRSLVAKYLLLILIIITVILASRAYANFIYDQETKDLAQIYQQAKDNFTEKIAQSEQSAYQLMLFGLRLMEKNQSELAIIVLEEAAKRDQNYRDAALLTGWAYLRLSEELRNKETEKQKNNITKEQYNHLALEYLLKARDLDPIYARTHQLLAIAYKNLGDTQQAALAQDKARAFATDSSNGASNDTNN